VFIRNSQMTPVDILMTLLFNGRPILILSFYLLSSPKWSPDFRSLDCHHFIILIGENRKVSSSVGNFLHSPAIPLRTNTQVQLFSALCYRTRSIYWTFVRGFILKKTGFWKLDLSASSGKRVRIRQKEPFLITEQADDSYRRRRTWTFYSD